MTKLRNTWLSLLTLVALLAVASVSCGPGGDPPPTGGDIEAHIIVDGPGHVIQGPIPYECRDDCLWTGDGDATTSFAAVPDPVYVFVGWEGVCDVLENPCTRTFEDGDTITATFALHALRLDLIGDGEGAFTISGGGGITATCDADCALALPPSATRSSTTPRAPWARPSAHGAPHARTRHCRATSWCRSRGARTSASAGCAPPVAADEAYDTTRNATLTVDAPGVLATWTTPRATS